jgi:hypothetical protein
MPNEQTAMSWWEQDIMSWDDNVGFVLDQHIFIKYSAHSLKQQSVSRCVASIGHIILIPSKPVFALTP